MSTRARRYTTQARVLACLQAVCCLYRLSKNDSSPLSEKKPFYIIPGFFCPDKGAAIAVLDQLRDIQVNPDGTELSFLNYVNSSSRPDGDWWGKDVLLTAIIGGIPVTRWLKFKNWY